MQRATTGVRDQGAPLVLCPACLSTGLAVTHPPLFDLQGVLLTVAGRAEITREAHPDLTDLFHEAHIPTGVDPGQLSWAQHDELTELVGHDLPSTLDPTRLQLHIEVVAACELFDGDRVAAGAYAEEMLTDFEPPAANARIVTWSCRCAATLAGPSWSPVGSLHLIDGPLRASVSDDPPWLEDLWSMASTTLATMATTRRDVAVWQRVLDAELQAASEWLIRDALGAQARRWVDLQMRRRALNRAHGFVEASSDLALDAYYWTRQEEVRDDIAQVEEALRGDPRLEQVADAWEVHGDGPLGAPECLRRLARDRARTSG